MNETGSGRPTVQEILDNAEELAARCEAYEPPASGRVQSSPMRYEPLRGAALDYPRLANRMIPTLIVCVRCGKEPLPIGDAWVIVDDGIPTGPSCEDCARAWNEDRP